ncbi:succinate dehydrogenase, hydrophobic membrane anchor protein [Gilvimarinus agarilyticus]|uniref:succinate dehydrogenase, hydrophobic membrane anchor protein n=1 Tax=unclassified Gilvimarinus TaxID=2642066 RepID=UPI001C09D9DC|nr:MULTISPECIES: succinate dehydrogenase, hydrophobic membrane anchor protein [unclassified Gilvimarinus]MBU2887409.1 succinate dehydrogenase, hydrophobic membrane anchor protein [Gilvimarinus agarilyticus]MDO6572068.1 succinate dehydrogenase, hydrophobic membrane anchor protein [Gilvimarinus sp. 2_MG-2023]MDO6746128.1 succinate dehydrogenase, hydrophobic membrane anchor protein [Gilvimarinus sp. 1_MG-2023]
MVTSITNLGRSGLSDWFIQRISAVVMVAYIVFLVAYLVINPDLDFNQWRALFAQLWMRVFSVITLLSIVAHAWIGLWAVLTDYITTQTLGSKATAVRVFVQLMLALVAVTYVVWGFDILWGL